MQNWSTMSSKQPTFCHITSIVKTIIKIFQSIFRVLPEMCVALCMENGIEFLTFQLALIAIGATPILLSPGHVGRVIAGRITKLHMSNLFSFRQNWAIRLWSNDCRSLSLRSYPTVIRNLRALRGLIYLLIVILFSISSTCSFWQKIYAQSMSLDTCGFTMLTASWTSRLIIEKCCQSRMVML